MNAEAQRYLQRATRGLWGRRRREVREELAAHLEGRVTAHRIAGLPERDATEKALAELGSPQIVSVGMARLYTLPTVMGSSLMFAAACAAVIASLPNGLAQSVPGTFYWPSAECISAVSEGSVKRRDEVCFWNTDSFWVNQDLLKRALEPQGVTFSSTSVPGASDQSSGLMKLTFQNEATVYTALGSPDYYLMDENGRRMPTAVGYFSFWDLLRNMSVHKELNVSVTGWNNPHVSFNDVSFRLGTTAARVSGERFYSAYLGAILERDFSDSIFDTMNAWGIYALPSLETDSDARQRLSNLQESRLLRTTVTLRGTADDVYGLLTYLEPNGSLAQALLPGEFPRDAFFLVQPVRLSKDGTVSLELPNGSSTFIERFGNELIPNTSMLVRLAGGPERGEGWYEVISPEAITLEARP